MSVCERLCWSVLVFLSISVGALESATLQIDRTDTQGFPEARVYLDVLSGVGLGPIPD